MPPVSHKGFTLVEIIVASLILTTVLVGLLRAFVTARGFQPPQFTRSVASNLAREKLETLYEAVRQDFWEDAARPLGIGLHEDAPIVMPDGITFTRKTVVSSVDMDGGGEDFRKADITVSW